MLLDVRYTRSFLRDLNRLKPPNFERVYEFVFHKFVHLDRLQDLPDLHQLGSSPIFYRFRFDNYLIAIEVIGHVVKFLRILPIPEVGDAYK
ncbi:cytotoxic translational repressor of toxin-antitoxin stability system [Phormidium sp. CCY1219]|uniref:cytotoxic translational repressor of toxin-antitoxin stability system n=1 Tax=Phormidium sp. CCY1219 TaxID=2886104 RepID=UPI002D1E7734|nr:cytotoxic translational repressor of toxin-antitoxin stability system [Phormidium sp. CCY1219]MEB3827211.1 cytotoxic translational repressor of toxin-antitoxin stability system [Phormidium sp. CCY1219]